MLSSPRCGTGNLKEGRSLSMHLTSYCMGPILLFHAQRGTLAKKHSHELMLSGSCPSTHQLQIRNFNSLTVDVSVPTIIHCMACHLCYIYPRLCIPFCIPFFGFPVPGILGNYFQVPAKKRNSFPCSFFSKGNFPGIPFWRNYVPAKTSSFFTPPTKT